MAVKSVNNKNKMSEVASNTSYHHGDLRQTLIEAACKQLQVANADALSMRALARDAGVSQAAPFRHFESKTALFAAIATYGFALLAVDLQKAADKFSDDFEKSFIEVGMAYIHWAQLNPEKYQLFFDSSLVDFSHYKELHDAGEHAFSILIDLIERGVEQDLFVDRPVLEMAGAMWAGFHGTSSLLISKLKKPGVNTSDGSAVTVMSNLANNPKPNMEMLLAGLKKP